MNRFKNNSYLYQIAFVIVLLVLLAVRFFSNENILSKIYVGLINYIGAASAFLLTSKKLILAFPVSWHKGLVWLWLAIFVCALVYGAISLGLGIIYSEKESDCITILALIFSIPCDAYYVIIQRIFANNSNELIS